MKQAGQRQAKVSLCMIVRDEEEYLAACLEAARPFVDEMCIVDTGSKDRTIAIAESFGARVKCIEWPDSFAKARNVSLEMATGDWTLVIDADEVLRDFELAEFNALVDNPKYIGGFIRLTNHHNSGTELDCLVMRLFRTDPAHRFQWAMHEQVVESVVASGEARGQKLFDMILHADHYGYMIDDGEDREKDARNRFHFERALEEDPDCAYMWFKFGDFLRRFDEKEPVFAALGRACELIKELPDEVVPLQTYCAEPHALLALELVKEGEYGQAEALLRTALDRCQATPMLYWVWGHYSLCVEEWDQALEAFDTCHALDGKMVHIPAQPGITSYRSIFGMARALLGKGESEKAFELFRGGLERWPESEDLTKAVVRIECSERKFSTAVGILTSWLQDNTDDGDAWRIGAEVLLEIGMLEQSTTWADRARIHSEGEDYAADTAQILGEVALAQGQLDAALASWNAHSEHLGCQAGLALLALMAQKSIPDDFQRLELDFQVAINNILRRLRRQKTWPALSPLLQSAVQRDLISEHDTRELVSNQLEAGPALAAV